MRRFTIWDEERQNEANGAIVELYHDTPIGMLLDLQDAIEKHCEGYDQRMVEWPVERVILARETGTDKPILRFEVDLESVPQYRANPKRGKKPALKATCRRA